jgi:hypothetical protein
MSKIWDSIHDSIEEACRENNIGLYEEACSYLIKTSYCSSCGTEDKSITDVSIAIDGINRAFENGHYGLVMRIYRDFELIHLMVNNGARHPDDIRMMVPTSSYRNSLFETMRMMAKDDRSKSYVTRNQISNYDTCLIFISDGMKIDLYREYNDDPETALILYKAFTKDVNVDEFFIDMLKMLIAIKHGADISEYIFKTIPDFTFENYLKATSAMVHSDYELSGYIYKDTHYTPLAQFIAVFDLETIITLIDNFHCVDIEKTITYRRFGRTVDKIQYFIDRYEHLAETLIPRCIDPNKLDLSPDRVRMTNFNELGPKSAVKLN